MKLFDESLPFLKGNLHCHTTLSDGHLTPEESLALYRNMGYDFLAFTDHWRLGKFGCFRGMALLSGLELDVTLHDQVVHLIGIGLDDWVEPASRDRTPQQLLDLIRAQHGRAILAHPAWSLNTPEMIASLNGLSAVEIFNSFSGIPWNAARADSSCVLDLAACTGTLLPFVASDDTHAYTGEAGMSYTCVQAAESTPQAILTALDAGRIYASQGPDFRQIEINDDRMIVDSSPVDTVIFYSNLPWVSGRCRSGHDMTHHEYPFQRERGERFVRCELIDCFGRRAWCSPIAL